MARMLVVVDRLEVAQAELLGAREAALEAINARLLQGKPDETASGARGAPQGE